MGYRSQPKKEEKLKQLAEALREWPTSPLFPPNREGDGWVVDIMNRVVYSIDWLDEIITQEEWEMHNGGDLNKTISLAKKSIGSRIRVINFVDLAKKNIGSRIRVINMDRIEDVNLTESLFEPPYSSTGVVVGVLDNNPYHDCDSPYVYSVVFDGESGPCDIPPYCVAFIDDEEESDQYEEEEKTREPHFLSEVGSYVRLNLKEEDSPHEDEDIETLDRDGEIAQIIGHIGMDGVWLDTTTEFIPDECLVVVICPTMLYTRNRTGVWIRALNDAQFEPLSQES